MQVLVYFSLLLMVCWVTADVQRSTKVLYHLDKEDEGLTKAFQEKVHRTLARKAHDFLTDYNTTVDISFLVVRKQYLKTPLYYLNFEAAYSAYTYLPKSQGCPEKKPEVVSCTASLFKDSDDIPLQTYLTNPACQ